MFGDDVGNAERAKRVVVASVPAVCILFGHVDDFARILLVLLVMARAEARIQERASSVVRFNERKAGVSPHCAAWLSADGAVVSLAKGEKQRRPLPQYGPPGEAALVI